MKPRQVKPYRLSFLRLHRERDHHPSWRFRTISCLIFSRSFTASRSRSSFSSLDRVETIFFAGLIRLFSLSSHRLLLLRYPAIPDVG